MVGSGVASVEREAAAAKVGGKRLLHPHGDRARARACESHRQQGRRFGAHADLRRQAAEAGRARV